MLTGPVRWTRWLLRRDQARLRKTIQSLRRREGTLSFQAEQGGPSARQAAALAAALQCILADQLSPAADALERALFNREPLPEESEGDDESHAA